MIEMQAILIELLENLEFSPPPGNIEIIRVQRVLWHLYVSLILTNDPLFLTVDVVFKVTPHGDADDCYADSIFGLKMFSSPCDKGITVNIFLQIWCVVFGLMAGVFNHKCGTILL
jgi:hypothetical protein